MKKVQIIGKDFYCYTRNLIEMFQNERWETKWTVHVDNCSRLSRFINPYLFRRTKTKSVADFDAFKPDLVVVVKGTFIGKEELEYFRAGGARVILFLQDRSYRSLNDLSHCTLYDRILLFDNKDRQVFEKIGCEDIQFFGAAVNPRLYHPLPNVKKDIDISFVGNVHPFREQLLEEIIRNFPDRRIEIYGTYLGRLTFKRWWKYWIKGYRRYFKNRRVTAEEANEIYNRSKICLNLQHDQSEEGCNPRVFEIMATSSFQLCSATPWLEREVSSDNLIYYRVQCELIKLVKEHLDKELKIYDVDTSKWQYQNRFDLFELGS